MGCEALPRTTIPTTSDNFHDTQYMVHISLSLDARHCQNQTSDETPIDILEDHESFFIDQINTISSDR